VSSADKNRPLRFFYFCRKAKGLESALASATLRF
jgi:hypothetical protein